MNPVLNTEVFIPDVEARKMPDGRLYIYGSVDNSGDTEFCSTRYLTYSTTDLIHWKEHGTIFDSLDPKYELNSKLTLGAPDCLCINGKYYLYYCEYGNRMGVAVSESPTGPFKNIGPVLPANEDSIDPAIFQDDDGSIYYFWGQFNLRGGQLAADMRTVIPDTLNTNLLTEHEHGFHEGASIRKFNGVYYMLYTDISRGKATCLAYATAPHPLGPYIKRGIVIDNSGCDSSNWNNHGSIEEYNGNLYIFYHRSSQNSIYNRRLCVERIVMKEDGTIPEISMTSAGVAESLDATEEIRMSVLSKMKVKLPFDHLQPMRLQPTEHNEVLTYTKENDWVQFDNLDFGDGCRGVQLEVATVKSMKVEIWCEGNRKLGTLQISHTDSWNRYQKFEASIEKISGIHSIWLVFKSNQKSVGRLGNIKSLVFCRED